MENKEQSKTSNTSSKLIPNKTWGTIKMAPLFLSPNLILRDGLNGVIKIEENKISINGEETEDAEVIGNALKLFAKHYFNENK